MVRMDPTPNPRTFLFTPEFDSLKFPTPLAFEKTLHPHPDSAVSKILALPGVERLLLFSPHSASVSLSSEKFADESFKSKVAGILADNNSNSPQVPTEARIGSAVEEAIQEVLDFRVRPSIQADGGDVELVCYYPDSKTALLRMKGACEGCPSSEQTLRNSITETLKYFLPNDILRVDCTEEETGPLRHIHNGEAIAPDDKADLVLNTPFVSLFAAKPVDSRMKERVSFSSHLSIPRTKITPDLMVQLKCGQCGAIRALEAIDSLLLTQPQKKEKAAVVICPACVVVCSVVD